MSEPPASTLIRLPGRDALSVVHRISTAKLDDLTPGRARMTLFCDFRGRLQHRAAVAVAADGVVWLLRDDAPAAELAAFVDQHVFREDVRIEPSDPSVSVRAVTGDLAGAAGTVSETEGRPTLVRIAPDFGYAIGPTLPQGATLQIEAQRIRAGRPRHGHEIDEAFNPYEIGLASDVHLSKGCFTGQEALLRLMTYESVRRRLTLVGGPGPPPAPPSEARSAGERAGVVTSAIAEGDGWIGLASLRRDALERGAAFEFENGRTLARVEPFPEGAPLGWTAR